MWAPFAGEADGEEDCNSAKDEWTRVSEVGKESLFAAAIAGPSQQPGLSPATVVLRTLLWLLSRWNIGVCIFPEREKVFVASSAETRAASACVPPSWLIRYASPRIGPFEPAFGLSGDR
jgi:hypothetical protein